MSELEWMEREERYRQRVTRLLVGFSVLVFALLGITFGVRARHDKAARRAATEAADAATRAEQKRERDAFAADSAAAANRYTEFCKKYGAKPLAASSFLEVPLAPGVAIGPFVEKLWSEYARVVDPKVSSEDAHLWYTQYYVDAMNRGPLRPRSVLLPLLDQQGTTLSIRKTDFPKITQAQANVGMRPPPAPAPDSAQAAAAAAGGPAVTPAAADVTPAAAAGGASSGTSGSETAIPEHSINRPAPPAPGTSGAEPESIRAMAPTPREPPAPAPLDSVPAKKRPGL